MKLKSSVKLTLVLIFTACWGMADQGEKAFVYDAKGKKDPFSPPGLSATPLTDVEISGKMNELKKTEIQGIVWDEKNPMAMINDEIIIKGQEFKGAKVVDIRQHAVIMEFKGEVITLDVKEQEAIPAPVGKQKDETKTPAKRIQKPVPTPKPKRDIKTSEEKERGTSR